MSALPLLTFPILLYNIFVWVCVGPFPDLAEVHMSEIIWLVPMVNNRQWAIHTGDLFILIGLFIMTIEILKSNQSGRVEIVNHSLSMLLFSICFVEFLLFRNFSTSTFFLLTAMVFMDVISGFIISILASRE